MSRTKVNAAKRQKVFFEADGQELYDLVIGNLVPLHGAMIQVFETLIRTHCSKSSVSQAPVSFLDVGSGTGTESLWVAREFPNARITAVDPSARMNAIFTRKLALLEEGDHSLASRVSIKQEDFLKPKRASFLSNRANSFDVIFSIFAFHHFKHREKAAAYRRAFSMLRPGGVFINGDLFGYESKTLAALALDHDLKHIEECFEEKEALEKRHGNRLALNNLRQKWLEHYKKDNITEPIEGISGQVSLMTDAGFKDAACPFRYWQVGLVVAFKR